VRRHWRSSTLVSRPSFISGIRFLEPYFGHVVHLLIVTGMLFLLFLNPMLLRLALMLPDETLRVETRLFTKLNQFLLTTTVVILSVYFVLAECYPLGLQQVLDLLFRLNPFPETSGTLIFSPGVSGSSCS